MPAAPGRSRRLAVWGGIGGLGPVFVGSPSTIADILEDWVEETDVDGFNLAYALAHETFEDIVHYLVPELQKRGVYPTEYKPGTLRDKLFGDGPLLSATHPGRALPRHRGGEGRRGAPRGEAHKPRTGAGLR